MTVDPASEFEAHRPRLTRLAYRMLGAVSEAEDAVQDAYLRWHRADRSTIGDARAWLSQVTARLCLDRLRQARRKREIYVGQWLPEPLVDGAAEATLPEETDRSVSMALMLALERLSPLERAAFILHDVFEMGFAEVAAAIGRSEAACRQLASRAREHVRAARPRFAMAPEEGERLASAFFAAARSGDTAHLQALLAQSAVLHSDGGGRKAAVRNVLAGASHIAQFFGGLARKGLTAGPLWTRHATINGQPGQISVEQDGTLQTMALDIADGRIVAIYVTRNPDKLTHLMPLVPAAVADRVAR